MKQVCPDCNKVFSFDKVFRVRTFAFLNKKRKKSRKVVGRGWSQQWRRHGGDGKTSPGLEGRQKVKLYRDHRSELRRCPGSNSSLKTRSNGIIMRYYFFGFCPIAFVFQAFELLSLCFPFPATLSTLFRSSCFSFLFLSPSSHLVSPFFNLLILIFLEKEKKIGTSFRFY